MTQIFQWAAGSGNFDTATNWSPNGVPGAGDEVWFDAAGTYTVTASANETVANIGGLSNGVPTLEVSAGTFTVTGSGGPAFLEANIVLDDSTLVAPGAWAGPISGSGEFDAGQPGFTNFGVVNGNGTAGLTIDTSGLIRNFSEIEASGVGGLTIAGGTIETSAQGATFLATNGSTLTFQTGVVNHNNVGGVLFTFNNAQPWLLWGGGGTRGRLMAAAPRYR